MPEPSLDLNMILRRIVDVPAYLLLAVAAPLAVLYVASKAATPSAYAYAFAALVFAVIVLLGWRTGEIKPKEIVQIQSKKYMCTSGEQREMAAFLASMYSKDASEIYVITSGYACDNYNPNRRTMMTKVLESLDECIKSGTNIIRLQIGSTEPLDPEYVDRVCAQINMTAAGECQTYDMTSEPHLSPLAVVQLKDGTGYIWQTIDRIDEMKNIEDPASDEVRGRSRFSAFAWRIKIDKKTVEDLKNTINDLIISRRAVTAREFKSRFGTTTDPMVPQPATTTIREA